MRYREHFHLDYWQAFFTPYRVVLEDMQILSIESDIKGEYRAQKKAKK